jgi:hypothetical protein
VIALYLLSGLLLLLAIRPTSTAGIPAGAPAHWQDLRRSWNQEPPRGS